jgi:hypothetical protein
MAARAAGEQRTMRAATIAAAAAAGLGARSARARAPFVRMLGSSIAGPDAAGWITDFLNAAHHARPAARRTPEDLRLALTIVTTAWDRGGHRRLRAWDALPFHRAFGRLRFDGTPRGTLDRAALLRGAERLLGDWFEDAVADPARTGWGIAFPTVAEREAHDPTIRLRAARLGPLTPPSLPPSDQVWHTYEAVPVPNPEGALELLGRPSAWPSFGTELGRFTALRAGGLQDQTFEIEIMTPLAPRLPAYTRGYVTVTALRSTDDEPALRAYVERLNADMVRIGRDEPPVVPEGGRPLAVVELTTHEGHFLGAGISRLVLYEADGGAWLRDAGTWDDLPFPLDQAYRRAGRVAQERFWGAADPDASMLHQIALRSA